MKQNLKSKKVLYSLYTIGAVLGASLVSGCTTTRYVYLNADGSPAYTSPARTRSSSSGSTVPSQILSGILMGLGGGL